MIKKVVGIILAIVMIVGNCTSTRAAPDTSTINSNSPGSNSVTKEILGKYINEASSIKIYSVNVSWGDLTFKYTVKSEKKWNPTTHQYDEDSNKTGTWGPDIEGGDVVSITNHSNAAIIANLKYLNTGVESVQGSFNNASIDIENADGKSIGDEVLTKTSKLSLNGNPGSTWNGTTKLGDITITIS